MVENLDGTTIEGTVETNVIRPRKPLKAAIVVSTTLAAGTGGYLLGQWGGLGTRWSRTIGATGSLLAMASSYFGSGYFGRQTTNFQSETGSPLSLPQLNASPTTDWGRIAIWKPITGYQVLDVNQIRILRGRDGGIADVRYEFSPLPNNTANNKEGAPDIRNHWVSDRDSTRAMYIEIGYRYRLKTHFIELPSGALAPVVVLDRKEIDGRARARFVFRSEAGKETSGIHVYLADDTQLRTFAARDTHYEEDMTQGAYAAMIRAWEGTKIPYLPDNPDERGYVRIGTVPNPNGESAENNIPAIQAFVEQRFRGIWDKPADVRVPTKEGPAKIDCRSITSILPGPPPASSTAIQP